MPQSFNRPGRPGQDKVHLTITLSRRVREALEECESNISTFLESQALKDEHVAAYIAQNGICKVEGCKERIDGNVSVYCAVPGNRSPCPGWFCPEHYAQIHFPDSEE